MRSRSAVRDRVRGISAGLCMAVLAGAVPPARAQPPAAPRIPAAFPHAVAGYGCTQEDIPAIEIILTTRDWNGDGHPPTPYLRIEAAGLVTERPGTLALSPLRRDPSRRSFARAAFHDGPNTVTWLSGSVRIDRLIPGEPVPGRYTACPTDAPCSAGDFMATWRAGPAHCG